MFNGYANEAFIYHVFTFSVQTLGLYECGTLKRGELKLRDNILALVEWKDFRCYKVFSWLYPIEGPYRISMPEDL